MKNTTPDAAVLQELKELTSRIFKICEQNNMPVVIGYSYELSRNENGYSINKSITAYADEKKGAWNSTIAAAVMMLRMKEVPKKAIHAMAEMAAACELVRAMSEDSEEKSLH
ncbi:hypothetical protein LHS21_000527 [Salmonella enterica subsp. enterica serovar Newport]|nr:hypothetical protein [Salmonella enterica subsp. enterica serovar Newport]